MKKRVFLNLYRSGQFNKTSSDGGIFFEEFGVPLFAYSLRDLRGDDPTVVTIRRGGDSAEKSFTASEVQAETSVLSFVNAGNGNGRVKTWHNQVVGGDDITQLTSSLQTSIVVSGVMRKINSKPSIYWDGTVTHNMELPSSYKNAEHNVYLVNYINNDDFVYPVDSSNSSNYGFAGETGSASTSINSNYGSVSLYVNGTLSTPSTRDDVFTAYNVGTLSQISILNEDVTGWTGAAQIGETDFIINNSLIAYIPEYIAYPTGSLKTGVIDNQKTFYSIT